VNTTRDALREDVWQLPVWDTHTHLTGGKLPAATFWDIGHYFWLLRELRAAGYPADADKLPDDHRFAAYAEAYARTRNTSMAWCLRRIFIDLYSVVLDGEDSLREADAKVRERHADPNWSRTVIDAIGLRKIITNVEADAPFPEADGVARCQPRLESILGAGLKQLREAADEREAGKLIAADLQGRFMHYRAAGYRGVMTSEGPFGRLAEAVPAEQPELARSGTPDEVLKQWLLHTMCEQAAATGLWVQLFLGVESHWPGGATPSNFSDRILHRYGLFKAHDCAFQLVLGASGGNIEAVNAARIFPHVRVGGLWWYNYRASSYREAMQARLEALPAEQCALIASDARCIEWCYGKIALVKVLLADFLAEQVDAGWLSRDDAVWVARVWLHDAAAGLDGQVC